MCFDKGEKYLAVFQKIVWLISNGSSVTLRLWFESYDVTKMMKRLERYTPSYVIDLNFSCKIVLHTTSQLHSFQAFRELL